jgi:hypothetical protein
MDCGKEWWKPNGDLWNEGGKILMAKQKSPEWMNKGKCEVSQF